MKPRSFKIVGTGIYLPRSVVDSTDIDARLGKPPGWTEDKSGVVSRRFADSFETTSWMAAQAASSALLTAGLAADQIDLVLSACGTMEQAIPCTAVLVQRQLGLSSSKVAAFDVNSTCLSFVTALDMASALMEVGRYRKILIVSSDIPSLGLDWTHLESCTIFGDGAAAMVVEQTDDADGVKVLASHMETFSEGADICRVRAGGTRFHPTSFQGDPLELSLFEMDGKAAYKLSAEHIDGFVENLFRDTGLSLGDIGLVIPHQASKLAMHHLRKRLGIPSENLVDIFSTHGNQVAASIPSAFHAALSQGRIQPGHKVLVIGTGAGISIAGMVLEFPA